MKRRDFIASTAMFALVAPAAMAMGGKTINYEPGVIKNALAEGKTVFVDYATDWCSTCARQERVISDLRSENPEYDENIVFVRVDWDVYSNDPISTSYNIPRRSTLLVLHGDEELGRIVAGTSVKQIKGLLDKALRIATS